MITAQTVYGTSIRHTGDIRREKFSLNGEISYEPIIRQFQLSGDLYAYLFKDGRIYLSYLHRNGEWRSMGEILPLKVVMHTDQKSILLLSSFRKFIACYADGQWFDAEQVRLDFERAQFFAIGKAKWFPRIHVLEDILVELFCEFEEQERFLVEEHGHYSWQTKERK